MYASRAHLNAAAKRFKEKHPDLVKAADAKGIDWKSLLEKLGPLLALVLKVLLGV